MMAWLLDKLVPWWLKLAAIAAILMALWGAWVGFKHWVSKPMVQAALVKERAETAPKIKLLQDGLAKERAKILAIETASSAEKARLTAVIELKTKDLGNALTQNKTFKAELTRLHGDITGFNSVLDTITANNHRATGASARARLEQLGAAHVQCEKEYRAERVEHGETLGELGQALAVVRALKQ